MPTCSSMKVLVPWPQESFRRSTVQRSSPQFSEFHRRLLTETQTHAVGLAAIFPRRRCFHWPTKDIERLAASGGKSRRNACWEIILIQSLTRRLTPPLMKFVHSSLCSNTVERHALEGGSVWRRSPPLCSTLKWCNTVFLTCDLYRRLDFTLERTNQW